jgi:hypothetical protein
MKSLCSTRAWANSLYASVMEGGLWSNCWHSPEPVYLHLPHTLASACSQAVGMLRGRHPKGFLERRSPPGYLRGDGRILNRRRLGKCVLANSAARIGVKRRKYVVATIQCIKRMCRWQLNFLKKQEW